MSCRLYFRGRRSEFEDGYDKVTFAISYLRGTAQDLFEPYILGELEDEPFMSNWSEFVEHLTSHFGQLYPEDDAEEQLELVAFPESTKAVKFFTMFEKYKNRTSLGERAYRRYAYKALPARIKEQYSKIMPKPQTYEALKAYVLQIDQRHWERVREEQAEAKLRSRILKSAQASTTSSSKGKQKASTSSTSTSNSTSAKASTSSSGNNNSSGSGSKKKRPEGNTSTPKPDISKNLGPDGKLLPEVRQHRIDKGLCLLCGQGGHMASNCPHKGRQAAGRAAKPAEQKANAEASGSGSKK